VGPSHGNKANRRPSAAVGGYGGDCRRGRHHREEESADPVESSGAWVSGGGRVAKQGMAAEAMTVGEELRRRAVAGRQQRESFELLNC
jgi:hypothetical protein